MPISFTFSVEEYPLIDPVADDMIRITFAKEVLVDARSANPAAYEVTLVGGSGPALTVREVLLPKTARTSRYVILVVDKPLYGTHYRVTVTGIYGRDGAPIGGTSDFIGRRTKAADMVRGIPSHFSKKPESLIRTILTAIGIEDETIGGSRSDTFL